MGFGKAQLVIGMPCPAFWLMSPNTDDWTPKHVGLMRDVVRRGIVSDQIPILRFTASGSYVLRLIGSKKLTYGFSDIGTFCVNVARLKSLDIDTGAAVSRFT